MTIVYIGDIHQEWIKTENRLSPERSQLPAGLRLRQIQTGESSR